MEPGSSDSSDSDNESIILSQEEEVEDEYTRLRKELSDLPFEELAKVKDKIGEKTFRMAVFQNSKSKASQKHSGTKVFKRENKNRPLEMSSKKRPTLKSVIPVKKKLTRDPRFDDLSGEYSAAHFDKSYGFLTDMKKKEKQMLLNQYKKEKDANKQAKMKLLIQDMNHQEQLKKQKEAATCRQTKHKMLEKELVKQGKKPFYLKKAEKKKLDLVFKYKELKKRGKLDKYLCKKRKQNAAKERKHLPSRH